MQAALIDVVQKEIDEIIYKGAKLGELKRDNIRAIFNSFSLPKPKSLTKDVRKEDMLLALANLLQRNSSYDILAEESASSSMRSSKKQR